MNEKKELIGIRNYIKYIYKRIAYINMEILIVPTNEYKYYKALYDEILKYGETHKLFYKLIFNKMEVKECGSFIGICERGTYRWLEKQKKDFINYIEKTEDILLLKYPFKFGSKRKIEIYRILSGD